MQGAIIRIIKCQIVRLGWIDVVVIFISALFIRTFLIEPKFIGPMLS